MSDSGAIFLSASVPVKGREGYECSDPHLIRIAVVEFVKVVLGRRLLVWGGHPAITPIILDMARKYGIEHQDYMKLYQSKFFEENSPDANKSFGNIIEVEKVDNDRSLSLKRMREEMFFCNRFSAAVFVGGMEGVREEFELFQKHNNNAKLVPVPSPGGVSRELFINLEGKVPREMRYAVDFSHWFYELLDIDPRQPRDLAIAKKS